MVDKEQNAKVNFFIDNTECSLIMEPLIQVHVVDPIENAWRKFRTWNWREALQQFLSLATIVLSALMIWKSLMLITGSESPVVVVLSGSMEPTMWRGDILALYMPETFEIGDIVVFNIKEREIPIIHRIIQTHIELNSYEKCIVCVFTFCILLYFFVSVFFSISVFLCFSFCSENGDVRILTKGDNNKVDDAYGIYAPGQMWLRRDDLMGKAGLYIPQAGFLTIWINETPIIKYIVIGAMCVYVLFFDDSNQ